MSESATPPENGAEEPAPPSPLLPLPLPEPPADPQPQPPPPKEGKAPRVPVAEEESDDAAKPLGEQLADEDAERRLREASLRTFVRGSSHRIQDSALFETHSGDINIGLGNKGLIEPRLLKDDSVQKVEQTHVTVPSYRELVNRLAMEQVTVVKGQPKSGRHWTALAALVRWAADGAAEGQARQVGTVTVRGDLIQADARRLDKHPHTGYVLDATGAPWTRHGQRDVVSRLQELADKLHGRFVVLTDPDGLPGHPSIRHHPPDPREVFENWLSWHLYSRGLSCPSALLEELGQVAGEDRPPAESANLAMEAATILADGGTTTDFVSGLPNALRQVAKEQLNADGSLRQRCFLISAAVLNELPLVTVSRAAGLLAELVHPTTETHENTTPPTWEWLPDWLQFAQADCSSQENATLVRLRRPRLAAAILEVVSAGAEHPRSRPHLAEGAVPALRPGRAHQGGPRDRPHLGPRLRDGRPRVPARLEPVQAAERIVAGRLGAGGGVRGEPLRAGPAVSARLAALRDRPPHGRRGRTAPASASTGSPRRSTPSSGW